MAGALPRGNNREVFTSTDTGPSAASEMRGMAAPWQALGDAGAELEAIATRAMIPEMQAKGAEAVTRDEAGNLRVEMRTPLNRLDEAFNHGAAAKYAADTEGDRRTFLADLAEKNIDDPVAFKRAADEYNKTLATNAPMELKADILAEGQREIAQHSEHLVTQKRRRDTANQLTAINTGIQDTTNDIYALAHQGGTGTPDFAAAVAKLDNQLNQKRNPIFGVSPEELASQRSEILSGAEAEVVLGAAVKEATAHGAEAGQDFLDKAIWNPDLNLTPAQREAFGARGRRQINQIEAKGREAAMLARQEVEYSLDDAAAAAEATGDWSKILTPRQITSAFPDNQARAADIISGLNAKASIYSARQMVKGATPADIASLDARLNPAKQLFVAGKKPEGMTEQGNLDLNARPVVKNADGSISTVRTITITDDKGAILIPTVIGDRVVSNAEAIDHYKRTGEHLGRFKSQDAADKYGEALHEQQAKAYSGAGFDQAGAESAIAEMFPGAKITSAARTVQHNAEVGGVPNSQHLSAQAVDFVLPQGATFAQVKSGLAAKGLPVSELIDEGDHVHWAWGKKQAGFADQLNTYKAFQQAVAERQQALAKDPAGYVSTTRSDITALVDSSDPAQVQLGVRNSLIAQRDLGVTAPKILGEAQSKAIVDAFANPENPDKPADNMVGIISSLEGRYGSYFPQVMAELRKAGMPAEAVALAQVKDDAAVAWRMSKAVNAGRATLRKGVAGADEIDKAVATSMAAFNRTLAGQNGSGQAAAQQVTAAQLYAYQLASEGVRNPGQVAFQDMIGKHYTFADTYRVPSGINAGSVSTGLRVLKRELPVTAIMPEGSLQDSRIDAPTRQRMSSQVLQGSGVWLTLPDDSGVYLAYPQSAGFVPGRRTDGRTISFTWAQVDEASKRRPVEAVK